MICRVYSTVQLVSRVLDVVVVVILVVVVVVVVVVDSSSRSCSSA